MSKRKNNNFLVQGSILAMAGLVSRIIGLLYRIPMTNIIGDEGMGVYSTAYSIYSILLLISSYSLPLAVSKMVSAAIGAKQYRNAKRVFTCAMLFGTSVSTVAALVMYFGAEFFSYELMHMPEAVYAMQALAPAVLIMGILGVLRGYFQGRSTMIPTAISQLLEQVLHVAVSLLAGYHLYARGAARDSLGNYYATSYGAAGATLGTSAGALAAMLFCLLLYLMFRPLEARQCRRDRARQPESYGRLLKTVIITIVPILISATVYQLIVTVDQAIYAAYIGEDYRSIWGVYANKYTLLYNVPIAIASALSASTIPAISGAMAGRNMAEVRSRITAAVRFSLLISIPSAVGLAVLAEPCMNLLFSSDTNALAARMMLYGSSAVVFFSLSTITNGILQGTGHFWIPIRNAVISLALHVPLLALFLWVLELDIMGVVLGNLLFPLFICLLNDRSLRRLLHYRRELVKTFFMPLLASGVMGALAYASYTGLRLLSLGNAVSLGASILLAILVYLVILLLSGTVDEVELASLPKGRSLAALARRLHLLRR